jgi:hypothetical protein
MPDTLGLFYWLLVLSALPYVLAAALLGVVILAVYSLMKHKKAVK